MGKMTRKGRKGNWFFYVQMAASEEDCSNYTASIQVFNLKAGIGGRNSHKFTGEVCSVDVTSTEKAAEEGFCQVLSDAPLKKDAKMMLQVPSSPSISESDRSFAPKLSPRSRQFRRNIVIGGYQRPNPVIHRRVRVGRIAVAPDDSTGRR